MGNITTKKLLTNLIHEKLPMQKGAINAQEV